LGIPTKRQQLVARLGRGGVMYKPIVVDRENLTLMGVPFPDLETLESAADGIGTNMFEGYEPTPNGIMLIRDLMVGSLSFTDFVQAAKDKKYAR
jgi:putative transcriptional regulator